MKTKLKLKRPLTYLKVQTTGTNPLKDRIIEICFDQINPDGTEKQGTRLINPGFEISAEITAINGITNEAVADKPTFEKIAPALADFLKDSDFAGFGIKDFDLKFLLEEFNRAGVEFTFFKKNIFDLMIMYRSMNPRNFKEAIKSYLNEEPDGQMTSSYNVKYSRELAEKMLEQHGGETHDGEIISEDVGQLSELFSYKKKSLDLHGSIVQNDQGRPIFTVGKYANQLVSESLMNDKKYYDWIINVSDFPSDTKAIIKKIVEKAKSAAEAAPQK